LFTNETRPAASRRRPFRQTGLELLLLVLRTAGALPALGTLRTL